MPPPAGELLLPESRVAYHAAPAASGLRVPGMCPAKRELRRAKGRAAGCGAPGSAPARPDGLGRRAERRPAGTGGPHSPQANPKLQIRACGDGPAEAAPRNPASRAAGSAIRRPERHHLKRARGAPATACPGCSNPSANRPWETSWRIPPPLHKTPMDPHPQAPPRRTGCSRRRRATQVQCARPLRARPGVLRFGKGISQVRPTTSHANRERLLVC